MIENTQLMENLNNIELQNQNGEISENEYLYKITIIQDEAIRRFALSQLTDKSYSQMLAQRINILESFIKSRNLDEDYSNFFEQNSKGYKYCLLDYCKSFVAGANYFKSNGESLSKANIDELVRCRELLNS